MALQVGRLLDKFDDIERTIERDLRRAQRHLKQSIPSYLLESRPLNVLAAPIIYSMIVPIALLDIWMSLYQWICFPLFGIPRVHRRDYIVVDRHKLTYLNGIEKLNCIYCGYANGVFAYAREVTGRTETYWCPIKHAKRTRDAHRYYDDFAAYGDAPGYKQRLRVLRRSLKK
ncbi:MAG TPA: hypothetical protein VJM31_01525 [Vicinamibacterales bacterium]|nr:hypothetical protein [Vicinamibacterales bacterium]